MPTRSEPHLAGSPPDDEARARQTGMAIGRIIGSRLPGFAFKRLTWLPLILGLPSFAAAAGSSPLVILDPAQSRVEISVKATVGSFVAQLRDFDAAVTVTSQTGKVEAAVFRFNFAAIKTGNTGRDNDMNEWQQTAKFPEVAFTLTALEPEAGGKSVAHGQLRFHGVERPVSFPVSIEVKQPTITLDGAVMIDTRDYGLPIIKKLLILKVDPVVSVHFHLQGKLAGP